MILKWIAALSLFLLMVACANPLNKVTYQRYLEMGAKAQREADAITAEIAYSRALGNVYIGNLGPEREAEALFNLGSLERVNGKLDLALQHLLKSLELDTNTNKASAVLLKSTMGEIAITYYDMNQIEEGANYLDNLYTLDKFNYRTEQSKKFILSLFSDYAVKFESLGNIDKSERYRKISTGL